MLPERWRQVERLYHAAWNQSPGERANFLAEACGGDEELLREVEVAAGPRGFAANPRTVGSTHESIASRRAGGSVQAGGSHWRGRNGTSLPGGRYQAPPHRRHQVSARARYGRPRAPASFPAGSQGSVGAEPPQHRGHLRHFPAGWNRLSDHGAHPRSDPKGFDPGGGNANRPSGRTGFTDRLSPGGRSCGWNRSPRYQAGEHHGHARPAGRRSSTSAWRRCRL